MLKKFIFTAFFISLFVSGAFSQQTGSKYTHWGFLKKPSLEASYGIAGISLNGLNTKLSNAGMFELKLGFTAQRKSAYGKNILKHINSFAYLSKFSGDYTSKTIDPAPSRINSDMWRFGAGKKEGYGVNIGNNMSIMPYTSTPLHGQGLMRVMSSPF